MLSLWKRKPKTKDDPKQRTPEPIKRDRQQNIKVSEDCSAAFAALAHARGISKAALFEDMVAERLDMLQRQGLELSKILSWDVEVIGNAKAITKETERDRGGRSR